jgi:hypothetical protein
MFTVANRALVGSHYRSGTIVTEGRCNGSSNARLAVDNWVAGLSLIGAGDETRTRDIQFGRLVVRETL